MKAFLSALSFLTILPLPRHQGPLFWAPVFFGPVGLIIAAVPAAIGLALGGYLPRGPVALIQTATWLALTGALHLDGLVDVADALGAKSKEDRLAVMKDSRVGTFGLVAGCLAVLARWQLLTSFSQAAQILLAGALSRGAAGVLLGVFTPARPGLAHTFGSSLARSVAAGIITLATAVAVGGPFGAALAVVSVCLMAALLAVQSRLFGGVTGDCYGAGIEITELFLLFLGGLAWSTYFP